MPEAFTSGLGMLVGEMKLPSKILVHSKEMLPTGVDPEPSKNNEVTEQERVSGNPGSAFGTFIF